MVMGVNIVRVNVMNKQLKFIVQFLGSQAGLACATFEVRVLSSAPSVGHRRGRVGLVDHNNLRSWLILTLLCGCILQMNSKQNASVGEESISMSPPNRDVSWTVVA